MRNPTSDYQELREAGFTDHQIQVIRQSGASHSAIIFFLARRTRQEVYSNAG